MTEFPLRTRTPVTIVGGGPFDREGLAEAGALAPMLVAADGAADKLASLGAKPDLIVGDMDSLADATAWQARGVPVRHLAEQETTDFEKCLTSVAAPLYVGLGLVGGRIDHTLAVFHAMLRHALRPTVLIGEQEVLTLVPAGKWLRVPVTPGSKVSLFPVAEATGLGSEGLRWPIEGLVFRAGHQIGTSNIADAPEIGVHIDRPGTLLTVERSALAALARALSSEGR